MLFTRSSHNPILLPNKNQGWESRKVYNPGAIYYNNKYHLFYRAVGEGKDWHSSIGYAVSDDGELFKRSREPLLSSGNALEKRGLEDPRITKIGNKYYLTYTAYDGYTARLCLATSKNLVDWERHKEMLPEWDWTKAGGFTVKWGSGQKNPLARKSWSKAGGIFGEIINDRYWMIFGDRNLWLATSDDGIIWEPAHKPFIEPREENFFDNVHLEMGPPPIETEYGWLVLYHGIDKTITYRLGFLLLDLDNPTNILYRSSKPIFEPREAYEMKGIVDILPGGLKKMQKMSSQELDMFLVKANNKGYMPKVVFCCGAVVVDNMLRIYYGASDTSVCTATAKLNDILSIYASNIN